MSLGLIIDKPDEIVTNGEAEFSLCAICSFSTFCLTISAILVQFFANSYS